MLVKKNIIKPGTRIQVDNYEYALLLECTANNGIIISRFLDENKMIDLEKLELAVTLFVPKLEFSDNFKVPIYLFIRDLDGYFETRGITPDRQDRIKEESTFILGFCQAVADEASYKRKIIVEYEQN